MAAKVGVLGVGGREPLSSLSRDGGLGERDGRSRGWGRGWGSCMGLGSFRTDGEIAPPRPKTLHALEAPESPKQPPSANAKHFPQPPSKAPATAAGPPSHRRPSRARFSSRPSSSSALSSIGIKSRRAPLGCVEKQLRSPHPSRPELPRPSRAQEGRFSAPEAASSEHCRLSRGQQGAPEPLRSL